MLATRRPCEVSVLIYAKNFLLYIANKLKSLINGCILLAANNFTGQL